MYVDDSSSCIILRTSVKKSESMRAAKIIMYRLVSDPYVANSNLQRRE